MLNLDSQGMNILNVSDGIFLDEIMDEIVRFEGLLYL